MLPQRLHHYILHVLQLVGLPTWLFGVGHLRGRGVRRGGRGRGCRGDGGHAGDRGWEGVGGKGGAVVARRTATSAQGRCGGGGGFQGGARSGCLSALPLSDGDYILRQGLCLQPLKDKVKQRAGEKRHKYANKKKFVLYDSVFGTPYAIKTSIHKA